jgi:hypothetical protein
MPRTSGWKTDQVNDGCEDWSRGTRPTIDREVTVQENGNVIAIRRNIRDAASDTVVHAAVGTKRGIAFVVGVWWVIFCKISMVAVSSIQSFLQNIGRPELGAEEDGTYVATALF